MKELIVQTNMKEYRVDELSSDEQALVEAARESSLKAYAPYSNLKVGAAVLLGNGEVISGNNQENVAYPSGMCAERVALFYANARYPFVPVKRIAIAAFRQHVFVDYISPCGACRQVLSEVEKRFNTPIQVLLCGDKTVRIIESARSLLPFAFDFPTE